VILFTLAFVKNDPQDRVFKPAKLNQRLANEIRKTIEQDYEAEAESPAANILLHPRDLRERVLKKLEDLGVFIRLEGKQEIIRQEHKARTPGKKSSDNQNGDKRGGKQPAYMMTEDLAKMRKTMEKAGAIEYIHRKIISSGLALALTKYSLLVFLHLAKLDKTAFFRMMTMSAKSANHEWTGDDNRKLELYFQSLQPITNIQLQEYAEKGAKFLINNRGYYEQLLFFIALIKL
jgi:hypothetical protein